MDYLERQRLKQINRRLSELKHRSDTVYRMWSNLNREKKRLESELRDLLNEKDNLEQGQLMFHVERA